MVLMHVMTSAMLEALTKEACEESFVNVKQDDQYNSTRKRKKPFHEKMELVKIP
jgi:hypothetical protein